MIGRTVDREIERDLHPALCGFRRSSQSKSSSVPSDGSTSLCPPGFAANRLGHAGIARLAGHRIVPAFAIRVPDRMNRRKINHVESHRFRVIDPRQTIAKGRSSIGPAFGRARKKFIPGGGPRRRAIDNHARRRRILGGTGAIGVSRHQHFEFTRVRDGVDLLVLGRADSVRDRPEPRRIGRITRALSRRFEQRRAFERFARQIATPARIFPQTHAASRGT